MRTQTCGELRKKDIGKKAVLQGWTNKIRFHGKLVFIDLRDRYGITQLVIDGNKKKDLFDLANKITRESVLEAHGSVKERKDKNKEIDTGDIEIEASNLEILNIAEPLPYEFDDPEIQSREDTRLKFRFLDLRRKEMQHNLIVRHKVAKIVRDHLDKEGFLEIETPMLAKSTPEGARDYLVPSRVNPGKFYALPQSPQLFKQLLMVSGFDRYFQIARCFRDEDLRADRQPEFTQIDVEMSFPETDQFFDINESMLKAIWKGVLGIDIKIPFPRLSYKEAMEKYGSDKPDTRFGLELIDVSDILEKSDFKIFTDILKNKGRIKAINAKNCAGFSRKDIEGLEHLARVYDAKGLVTVKYQDNKLDGSIVKFFNKNIEEKLIERLKLKNDDLILIVGDHKHHVVDIALGQLRLFLGKKLKLIDESKYDFLWVVDFPLVEFDENEQRHVAIHHPFTSPKDEDLDLLDKDPTKVRAKAYDIVLNGVEIGGGSFRIYKKEVQEKMFRVLGISKEEAKIKFGFLLDAFKYGAPPHGGIAYGLDRMIAILTNNESIREVIAFPKTKNAESLLEGAPSEVSELQLEELSISIVKPKTIVFDKITAMLKDVKYKVLDHKPVYTSKEAAAVRNTKLSQGAKALICKTEEGYILAVVPGDREIDLDKLRRILKVKKVQLADDIKKITGLESGAVPPFGKLFGLKTYIDKKLGENEEVAFNAGLHTKSIIMDYDDLVRISDGHIDDFSK